jgi:hypothetical protein
MLWLTVILTVLTTVQAVLTAITGRGSMANNQSYDLSVVADSEGDIAALINPKHPAGPPMTLGDMRRFH